MLTRFFDKHMKLRIAVQLLLDVMPMLFLPLMVHERKSDWY